MATPDQACGMIVQTHGDLYSQSYLEPTLGNTSACQGAAWRVRRGLVRQVPTGCTCYCPFQQLKTTWLVDKYHHCITIFSPSPHLLGGYHLHLLVALGTYYMFLVQITPTPFARVQRCPDPFVQGFGTFSLVGNDLHRLINTHYQVPHATYPIASNKVRELLQP
jgi:hypothetical protein